MRATVSPIYCLSGLEEEIVFFPLCLAVGIRWARKNIFSFYPLGTPTELPPSCENLLAPNKCPGLHVDPFTPSSGNFSAPNKWLGLDIDPCTPSSGNLLAPNKCPGLHIDPYTPFGGNLLAPANKCSGLHLDP